jgi:hypothetical protein
MDRWIPIPFLHSYNTREGGRGEGELLSIIVDSKKGEMDSILYRHV